MAQSNQIILASHIAVKYILKMNTLNSLALISFKRKARKLGKDILVANLTDQGFFEDYLVRAGETLIIWSEENGFHSIFTKDDDDLLNLVNFPDKYDDDEIHHYGVLNKDKTKLYVYRCYEADGRTGLKNAKDWYFTELALQEESDRISMLTSKGHGSFA